MNFEDHDDLLDFLLCHFFLSTRYMQEQFLLPAILSMLKEQFKTYPEYIKEMAILASRIAAVFVQVNIVLSR